MTSVEVLEKRKGSLELWMKHKRDDIGFEKINIETNTREVASMEKEIKDIENAIVKLEKK